MVFGAVSCASEDDDDDLEAIKGSNNDYSINFTNVDTTTMYRAYHATFNKHLGGLCQITIGADSYTGGAGTIGYIFDLESNPNRSPDRAVKEPRTFCIVGYNLSTKKVYISKFDNVTDIEENNFGAPVEGYEGNGAEEEEILAFSDMTLTADSDGNYVFTVDVNGNNTTGYNVKIFDSKIEKAALADATAKYSKTIDKSLLYPQLTETDKIPQQAAAVYVNVFGGKTLNASWHYADTYKAAEVIEE